MNEAAGENTSARSTVAKRYLKSATVLIVDQNPSARTGMKKLLLSLGAPLSQIYQANSFEEAESLIQTHKPCLVFCDFQIGEKFGLDLLQKQRQQYPTETQQRLFILVTSNTSQSAVAQAAEEDVDAYILKPYTIEGFTVSVTHAIQIKLQPSEYLQLITKGKELLEHKQYNEALTFFGLAMQKDDKPSLACYYEGLTHLKKAHAEGSQQSYRKGLTFSKIHYKCLTGLFDLLMSLDKFEAAYEIVRKIVRFFPANPKRLSTVLRLAIQTKHYEDIDSFYQGFLSIDSRSEELVKHICAALIVGGKHFFESGDKKMGIALVQKAAVSAAGNAALLRKTIETLVQYDELNEAKSTLKRFAKPTDDEPNYAVSSLLITNKEFKPELVAARGLELIKRGIKELEVYQITIACLEDYGKKDYAQKLREEGLKLYPELGYETRKSA